MKSKTSFWAVFVLVISVVVCMGVLLMSPPAASPQAKGAPIKVAIINNMKTFHGVHAMYGATMAVDEINAAGGVNVKGVRRPYEIIKVDSNEVYSIPDSVAAFERAVTVDKVDFLIGGVRSEASIAQAEVMADYKKIYILVGNVDTKVIEPVVKNYERYKYLFRLHNSTQALAEVTLGNVEMAQKRFKEELGVTKLKAALINQKSLYAITNMNIVEKRLPQMDIEVVGRWEVSPIASDVTAEMSAINSLKPHLIVTCLDGPAGIPVCKMWGQLQIPALLLGVMSEAEQKGFWAATGGAGNYVICTHHSVAPVEMTPTSINFCKKYNEKYADYPTCATTTYDALYILKEAIERAGTIETEAVVKELEKTDYKGVIGRVVFGKEKELKWGAGYAPIHDIIWGPGYMTDVAGQWVNGEMIWVWPYEWRGVSFKGTRPFIFPPWVKEYWKKK